MVEGVSGSGKTSVAAELERRGYEVIHGDRQLKYRGEPATGQPIPEPAFGDDRARAEWVHAHLCWPAQEVARLAADAESEFTFFCGGTRNRSQFLHVFDAVFVLNVDRDTLISRLEERAEDEWAGRGRTAERELVLRLHQTREDLPHGIVIDTMRPLCRVVDDIVRHCQALRR